MRKENFTLGKKLSFYSSFAGSLIGTAGIANGQVVYHDVDPDSVLMTPYDTMQVDLNNDGIFDFKFYEISASYTSIGFKEKLAGALPLAYSGFANAIAGTTQVYNTFGGAIGPFLFPYALNQGAAIDQNAPWFSLDQLKFDDSQGGTHYFIPGMRSVIGDVSYFGHWQDGGDHYLPLKIMSGLNANYGWARCKVASDVTSLTIESWAIQMTPNTAIEAGEGEPLGIGGVNTLQGVSIVAFEKNIYITLPYNMINAAVRLTNELGQEVKSINTNQQQIRFDVNDLANGLYIVTVQKDCGIISRKVSLR